MLKIAHFTTYYEFYGRQKWVISLVKNLKNFQNFLIYTSFDHAIAVREINDLDAQAILIPMRTKNSYIGAIFRLAKFLRRNNISILHTHCFKSNFIGYFAARLAGIKLIATDHSYDRINTLKARTAHQINLYIQKYCDLVTVISDGLLMSHQGVNPEKLIKINSFINLNPPEVNNNYDKKLITFMGRLCDNKGIRELITAIKQIKDETVNLQVIGDGVLEAEMKTLADELGLKNRVKFYGYRSDRLKLLLKFWILVLPSSVEGFPQVLMEAMMYRRLVISTDVAGNNEIITHGETGLLVTKKSPDKLAEMINYALKNYDKLKDIGNNAQIFIKENYSIEKAVENYSRIYKRLVN